METGTIDRDEAPAGAPPQVLDWRLDQLRRAGFESEDAQLLAGHLEVDLHVALDLARRGCPSKIAVQILL